MCYIIKRKKKKGREGSRMDRNYKIYDVLDISRYIINYSIEEGKSISNLLLQKILYYIQAAFLVEKNRACFKENIIHWSYGPVIEEAYYEFKRYGNNGISNQKEYLKFYYDNKSISMKYEVQTFDNKCIENNDKELINKVVRLYWNCNPFALVHKTHQEDPWKNTSQNEVMEIESIKKYFKENKDRLWSSDNNAC